MYRIFFIFSSVKLQKSYVLFHSNFETSYPDLNRIDWVDMRCYLCPEKKMLSAYRVLFNKYTEKQKAKS